MTEIIPLDRTRAGRARPGNPDSIPAARPRDRVYVVFTDLEGTLGAVRAAERFAAAVGARVTIVHFRPLDFGTPLEAPAGISPAETEAFRARLSEEGCDVEVNVCVCRDARQALPSVIEPQSLVLVGGRHRWWPTGADFWRRTLEHAGYAVVVVTDTNGAGESRG